MTPVVRVATSSDVPALAALRRAARDTPDPSFEERFARWFELEKDRTTWLVERGEAPVGMASLLDYRRMPYPGQPDGRWGYLGNMFVLEAHRDGGIGTLLLAAMLSEAKARGYVRVVLSPSPRSVPFYKRAGFTEADGAAGGDRLLVRSFTP